MQRFEKLASFDFQTLMVKFKDVTILDNDGEDEDGPRYRLSKTFLPEVFHEYLHYYHYFNSRYFLEGFWLYLETVLSVANGIRNRSSISRPYIGDDVGPEYDNWNAWYNLSGTVKEFNYSELHQTVETKHIKFNSQMYDQFPGSSERTITKFDTDQGSFYLGEYVLNESISYEMQKVISGKEPDVNDYPYRTGRKLYEEFVGESISTANLVLLLDRCLQTRNPGKAYIAMLAYLRGKRKILQNRNEFERTLYTKVMLDTYELQFYNYIEIELLNFLDQARTYDYFEIFEFLIQKIIMGYSHSKPNMLPMYLGIMDGDNITPESVSVLIHGIFYGPLIADQSTFVDGGYVNFHPDPLKDISKKSFLFLSSIKYLLSYISGTGNATPRCSFFEFCKQPVKDYVCTQQSWEIGQLKETCEVGYASAFLGLKEAQFR